jgi:methyltransferase (TIGR00027 family)
MNLENISDTARWVAVYRAMETARADAIFRDPFAARLAGARGEAIVDAMPQGRSTAWAMIVRTAVFDDIIMQAVRERGVDLVLNLAAGLDARPWRLDLPPSLLWIDIDLPDILRYKVEMLSAEQPKCRYEAIEADLREERKRQEIFAQVAASGVNALVVTEGLLIYLSAEEVGSLARDLRAQASFRWWLMDNASPRLLKMMQRMWGKQANAAAAPFRFAPAEGTAFFKPLGWREVEFRSTMDEARRLKREIRMMRFWRFLFRFYPAKVKEQFRRFAGVALLERE